VSQLYGNVKKYECHTNVELIDCFFLTIVFSVVHEGDSAESRDFDDLQVEAPVKELGQESGILLRKSGSERQEIVIVRGHDLKMNHFVHKRK